MKHVILPIALIFLCLNSLGQGVDCSSATSLTPTGTCTPSNHTSVGLESWFSFVATSEFIDVQVNSTDFGLDDPHIHGITLFSGSCGTLTEIDHDELAHTSGQSELRIGMNSSNLTIGNTYFIMLARKPLSDICSKINCSTGTSAAFSICIAEVEFVIPPDPENGSTSYSFEINKGQLLNSDRTLASDVMFYSRGGEPTVFALQDAISFVHYGKDQNTDLSTAQRVDMNLVGSNTASPIYHTEKSDGYINYFLSHAEKGVRLSQSFSRIIYKNVYPFIDFQLYSNSKGAKMYFVVNTGGDANPNGIELNFQGATSTTVTAGGGLKVETDFKDIEFERAHVYRINAGGNVVPMQGSGDFVQSGPNSYKINIQNYPANQTLIIQIDEGHSVVPPPTDEGPCWSTYLGGAQTEDILGVDVDPSGNQYATGQTMSPDFPVFQGIGLPFTSPQDVIAGKFNPAHVLEWLVFYGGSDDEAGHDVKIKGTDSYVCGFTGSSDFPYLSAPGAYNDATLGGTRDGFILKIDDFGFPSWCTSFGGNNGSDYCHNLAFTNTGSFYVVGQAQSNTGFPIVNQVGAYNQPTNLGLFSNPFIAEFDDTDNLRWCTFHGGSVSGAFNSLVVDASDNPIVTGVTGSSDFPTVDFGGGAHYQGTFGGGVRDHVITRFNSSNDVIWSSFIGGNGDDLGISELGQPTHRIDIQPMSGDIYLTGSTESTNFPLLPGGGFYDNVNSGYEGYLMRFDGSTMHLKWSTLLGATGEVHPATVICAPGSAENVFVAGSTGDDNFPLLQSPGIYYKDTKEGTSLSAAEGALLGFNGTNQQTWGTYFGGDDIGNPGESIKDMVATGTFLYLVGYTGVDGTLTTPFPLFDPGNGAFYDDTYGGGVQDGFITKLCIDQLVSVSSISSDNAADLLIFPNPGTDEIWVSIPNFDNKQVRYKIWDLSGRLVSDFEEVTTQSRIQLNVNSLTKGSYIITIHAGQEEYFGRFIKQ